jgi:hypothetical protein
MDQKHHWDKLREITSRTLEMTEYVIREVASISGSCSPIANVLPLAPMKLGRRKQ